MDHKRMLMEVSAISKKYDLLYQKTGAYFNIFDITNIGTDEQRICRVLSELLSPSGSHYQGHLFLSLFVKMVLDMDIPEEELKDAVVYREYLIEKGRRIDIVIKTANFLIPLEVKIYAGDQKDQCYDYFQTARDSSLYYLTPFGEMPSEDSMKGLKDGEVKTISFAREILDWLNACLEQQQVIKISSIREILLQLTSAIRNFTGQMEDEREMETIKTITSSKEALQSALDIEKTVPKVKVAVMQNFFNSLEEEFKKHNRQPVVCDKSEINNYYMFYKKTYPKIRITLKSFNEELNANLFIEVDHNLYLFFALGDKNHKHIKAELAKEKYSKEYEIFHNVLTNVIKNGEPAAGNMILWEYIYDEQNEKYNFKNFSGSCVNLVENHAKEAKRIVDICEGYIKAIMKELG